jgi:DNA-binding response OmpR family regulator
VRKSAIVEAPGQGPFRGHRIEVDESHRRAVIDGVEVFLRPREAKLLACLASEPGRLFTKRELEARVLGFDGFVRSRAIDQHVVNLRAKLPDPRIVRTVRGVGYRLDAGDDVAAAGAA